MTGAVLHSINTRLDADVTAFIFGHGEAKVLLTDREYSQVVREALRRARRQLPLMLLDDVMSELDPERRERLARMLEGDGQALITATELAHVPGEGAHRIAISAGEAMPEGVSR